MLEFLDEKGADLVRLYFDSAGPFAADTFDCLEPNPRDSFSASDLLALNCLDIRVRPRAIRALVDEPADHLLGALHGISSKRTLWDATDEDIGADSPAQRLWNHLIQLDGVGWVSASKLMARKRPRLIPIYDSVIKRALRPDGNWWFAYQRELTDEVVGRLESLHQDLDAGSEISLLRILDVAIWMRESKSQNAIKARSQSGG